MSKPQVKLLALALSLCIAGSTLGAQTTTSTGNQPPATTASKKPDSKTTASATPTDAQIAAAKSSHQVWVNTDSGVYHKGGRWYGRTKNGKFMSEADAKAAGYKAAARD